eukprot:11172245-Lingulodinium_polyedra.AAC.1
MRNNSYSACAPLLRRIRFFKRPSAGYHPCAPETPRHTNLCRTLAGTRALPLHPRSRRRRNPNPSL